MQEWNDKLEKINFQNVHNNFWDKLIFTNLSEEGDTCVCQPYPTIFSNYMVSLASIYC